MSYNGVTFNILTIDRADRRSVLTPDGADVLYTAWDIACTAVYAPGIVGGPGGTSITFSDPAVRSSATGALAGNVGNGVGPTAATSAPQIIGQTGFTTPGVEGPLLSDRDIRVRLAVPRRQLYIWGIDPRTGLAVFWLNSPRPGLPTDAKNGPFVRATPVIGIQGAGMSAAFGMEISTWEPPCPEGFDRHVLGHRWQMTHEWDADYYLTRKVTGQIWFHTGMMLRAGIRPDRLYQQLFHPIPLGFQRILGPVKLSPDGSSLVYEFADTDQRIVFAPGVSGATQIELKELVSYVSPGRVFHVGQLLGNGNKGNVGPNGPKNEWMRNKPPGVEDPGWGV